MRVLVSSAILDPNPRSKKDPKSRDPPWKGQNGVRIDQNVCFWRPESDFLTVLDIKMLTFWRSEGQNELFTDFWTLLTTFDDFWRLLTTFWSKTWVRPYLLARSVCNTRLLTPFWPLKQLPNGFTDLTGRAQMSQKCHNCHSEGLSQSEHFC